MRNAHAEIRCAVAQANEDRAGIRAETDRFLDGQRGANLVALLFHHQRVTVDHIGAAVGLAFQREQFLRVVAQVRGAIERIDAGSRIHRGERAYLATFFKLTRFSFVMAADEQLQLFRIVMGGGTPQTGRGHAASLLRLAMT